MATVDGGQGPGEPALLITGSWSSDIGGFSRLDLICRQMFGKKCGKRTCNSAQENG
jgi:hypothetical protein